MPAARAADRDVVAVLGAHGAFQRALVTDHAVPVAHRCAGSANTQELATRNGAKPRGDLPQGAAMRVLNPANPRLRTGGLGAGGHATNRIAAVTAADIAASNAVVHAIDTVPLP